MALIPDATTFQKRLAALPLRTYQAGEVVFRARSKTGQLLILKNGVVAIVKEDVEIAKVGEPGASHTRLMCVPWKYRNFTSPTPPCLCKTQRRCFTLPRPWRAVSTARIRSSLI